jgi:hypothetical protein
MFLTLCFRTATFVGELRNALVVLIRNPESKIPFGKRLQMRR